MLYSESKFEQPKQFWRSVLCGENEALENEAATVRELFKVCHGKEGYDPQAEEGAPGLRCDITICGVAGSEDRRAANH